MSGVVDLDVAWIAHADLEAADALARLQVAATRRGLRLRLCRPSSDLLDLLCLLGLRDVFETDGDDGVTGCPPGLASGHVSATEAESADCS